MIGCVAVLCIFTGKSYAKVDKKVSEKQEERFVKILGEIHSYGDYKWVTSFQSTDGTIYLHGKKKSTDGGRTVVPHDEPAFDEMAKIPEGAIFCRDELFLALDGPTHYSSPGVYHVRTWRSTDNLKTIKEEQAIVHVPEGPKRSREEGEWFGLYFHRTILEMPDGTLLATMEGNFESDKIIPTDRQSKRETKYKQRPFVVYSNDKGKNWNYLSTIAYPEPEDPVGEGFDEPTMVRLDNGQLLCVMRTGHHTPLYACWSEDDGKTWTKPMYTGLERGCDPCLLKLSDGRLLLSYGQRFPPGSDIDASAKWVWPGQGLVKLALSCALDSSKHQLIGADMSTRHTKSKDETGKSWVETTIGAEMGSCYSTIIEVEPNVIFCQVDGWFWRVTLRPRKDEGSHHSSHEGVKVSDLIQFGGGAVSRATFTPDGTIYLDNNKKSLDGGRTVVDCEPTDPKLSDILNSHRSFLNTHKHSQNRKRFLAIDYPLRELDPPEPNKFATTLWYSEDAFESPVRVGTAIFHIPAGKVKFGRLGLEGLYVHRGIFELDDGALFACCFGNFETDTIKPPPGADIGIQARSFLVKSVDGGRNWHYLSSIAVPNPNIVKNQEGYDEASLAVLDDGRYLVVMRTGHWTPLVASYSADGGLTWSEPDQLPGLRNGVDPALIKLRDGRLALAYGRNVRGGRTRELAISEDGAGGSWEVIVVSPAKGGNAYPTIFEVEPNVIFYQASSDCWRVTLKPRK